MNEIPAVKQDNLRVLLPSKVALTLEEIAKAKNTDPADEIAAFYASDVYRNLENESTKYWWFSPAKLCDMFLESTTSRCDGHPPSSRQTPVPARRPT